MPNPSRRLALRALAVLMVAGMAFSAQAQLPEAPAAKAYWIYFKDKGNTAQYRPEDILSPRALERRAMAGIPIDMLDYPVNAEYVRQVTGFGVRPQLRSRWFNALTAKLTPAQLAQIQALPFVAEVRQMGAYKVKYAQAKQEASVTDYKDYGPGNFPQVDMLNLRRLHSSGFKGEGVVMAICDDGFNNVNTLDAFKYIRSRNAILGWYDFVDEDTSVFQQGGHGTNVLSTIAGIFTDPSKLDEDHVYLHGTAPDAKFWLFRTENADSETPVEEENWVAAAERADSLGADIIHASLGYSNFDDPWPDHTYADMNGNTTVITRAADIAASKGMLVVNSAGNEGGDPWYYITAPADGDSVLTIGAVNAAGQIAYFSSRGPTSDGRIKPDICGQGRNTIVAEVEGTTGPSNGTSFSGPVIAGFSAAVLSANKSASGMQLLRAVKMSGSMVLGPDNVFGWGIPNADIADAYLKALQQNNGKAPAETKLLLPEGSAFAVLFVPKAKFGKYYKLVIHEPNGTRTEWFQAAPMHVGSDHMAIGLPKPTAPGNAQNGYAVELFNIEGERVFTY